uniref:Chitinase domain-containing protein 1 n=1 Tax=Bos taurus TaxID=9913 RepID=A0ABI0NRJ6_BOVIN
MRVLLGTLWLTLACSSVHATLSKSDAKKAASKTLQEKTQVSGKPAQERGLVVTDLRAEDVVLEHRSYCSAKAHRKHFAGDVLGYITPWNRHGYDVAKIFGGKFTHVAPVWLQLRRHGREMFEVTGLDDVDQGWLRAVRKQAKGLRIVPRLRFEDWTYEDFDSVLDNEDEIEELSRTVVQVAKSQHFDGLVVEVWNQLLVQKHAGLIHLLTHMAEALHQARLLVFLVIPPAVAPGTNKLGMFTNTEFEQLAPVLDGFSLMTYDYSTAQPAGPNAPLPWVRACVQVHPDTEGPPAPGRVGQPGRRALLRVQEKPRREARRLLSDAEVLAGAAGAGPGAGRGAVHLGARARPGLFLRPAVGRACSQHALF